MENQIIKLLKQNLDLSDFYVITIWDDIIRCQGHFNNDILAKYMKLGYQFEPYQNGFQSIVKNNLEITLI